MNKKSLYVWFQKDLPKGVICEEAKDTINMEYSNVSFKEIDDVIDPKKEDREKLDQLLKLCGQSGEFDGSDGLFHVNITGDWQYDHDCMDVIITNYFQEAKLLGVIIDEDDISNNWGAATHSYAIGKASRIEYEGDALTGFVPVH